MMAQGAAEAAIHDDGALTSGERAALATIALCAAALLATSLASVLDERTLNDVNVWSKPVKFAGSFGLHMATLLLFVRLCSAETRRSFAAGATLLAASVATCIEVFYVAFQSARGRASHFNTDTAFESFMYYQVMGGAALVLVAATAVIGVLILRQGRETLGAGLRLGAGWGAVISAAATLVVAGVLASGAVSGAGPFVGAPSSAANGLPIVGWSVETGDLRAPHFFATHIIQGLALVGWLSDRALSARPATAAVLVWTAAAFGLAVTGATFVQALSGQPLIPGLAA